MQQLLACQAPVRPLIEPQPFNLLKAGSLSKTVLTHAVASRCIAQVHDLRLAGSPHLDSFCSGSTCRDLCQRCPVVDYQALAKLDDPLLRCDELRHGLVWECGCQPLPQPACKHGGGKVT